MAEKTFKYRAFISYSHADEKWARWLHRSLEGYRIPSRLIGKQTDFGSVPSKLAPVFRDREELASATDLGATLTNALEESAFLIVICSRASAESHWVNEEILAYKRLGRSNRIFSLIVDGEPFASGSPGQEEEECFPRALRFQIDTNGELGDVPAEPIAADARPGKDGKAHAKVKLIAGLLGVGFDDLRQRELQRRNRRLAIISGSAIAGMVFAIGLATTAIIARNEAEAQRLRAETEAETARQTASFMIDIFAVSDPSEARGETITAREVLAQGANRISTELEGQPKIQTSLMDTIGKVYTSLGLYADASEMLEDAVAMRRDSPEIPPEEYAGSLYNLANVVTELAEYDRAEGIYEQSLEALAQDDNSNVELRIDITAALAELYFRKGDYESAEPMLHQVFEERLRLRGALDPSVADAIEEIGLNQFDQGKLPEAEAKLRESLELRWQLLGQDPHPDIAENLNNLALVLKTSGNSAEAESLYRDALEMNQRLYSSAHPAIALSMGALAEIYRGRNELDLAASTYRDAIAMQRELLGDSHPEVARIMRNLAFVYHDQGKLNEAISICSEALYMQRAILGNEHPRVANSLATLGRWYGETGDYKQAESMLREALDIQLDSLEPDHPETAVTRLDLAETLLAEDNVAEALEQARYSETALVKSLSENHWITAVARQVHGAALFAEGNLPEAEALILSAYQQLDADPAAKPAYVEKALDRLIALYLSWGKAAAAQEYQTVKASRSGSG